MLITVLFVNFILLRNIFVHNLCNVLKTNSLELNFSINEKFNTIERTAGLIIDKVTSENILPKELIEVVKLNTIIDNVLISDIKANDEFTANEYFWQTTLNADNELICSYHKKIDDAKQLVIELNEKWFEYGLSEKFVYNASDLNLFNSKFNVHFNSNFKSTTNVFEFDINYILSKIDSNGVFLKGIKNSASTQKYYAYVTYIPKIGTYLSLNHKQNGSYIYRGRYPAFISLIFVFVIMLSTYIIIRINNRYTKPYSEILDSFENDQFINISNSDNEPILIKRSIEQLQNQLKFYINKLEKKSSENKKIQNDLKIAKKLQNNILPTATAEILKHEELKICAISEAAFDIGGDLYDYYMLDEFNLLFVVGDVSGKGIPAALFMIYTQTLLRSIARPNMKVFEIIENLNNKLIEENISDLFVTMFLGIVDMRTGLLSYCNAAHNLPFIIRQEGSIDELEETHGIPLGIYANRNYNYSEIKMNPNDQILIYTDGLTDSIDENGMSYSVDVLKYNLMGTWFHEPKDTIAKIKKSVEEFRGNIDPADDMTILLMQYKSKVNI